MMKTTAELTDAERTELAAKVAELHAAGYVDLPEFTYPRSGKVLRVGTRVRHSGEQYWEALERGTGNVVALTHKPDSSWSRSWGMPDVELVIARDKARLGSRLSQIAQYHVAMIEED